MSARLLCALTAVAAGAATIFFAGAPEGGGMIQGIEDWILMVIAFAVAGATVLPRFVAPRAENWIWPVVGGLLTAPTSLVLAVGAASVDGVIAGHTPFEDWIFWLILGGLYAAFLGAPFFVAAALVAHARERRRASDGGDEET